MGVAATIAGLAIVRLGWLGVPMRVVRVALELWMCIALTRGSLPARFAYVLMMGVGGVIALASAGWPLGVFYLLCVVLLFTKPARAYFRDPSLADEAVPEAELPSEGGPGLTALDGVAAMKDDGFDFFNRLSGQIHIQLTEPPERIMPELENLKAPPSARLLELSIAWEVLDGGDFREVTAEEWSRPALRVASLRLRAEGCDVVVDHTAPNGRFFTVRDLANAVELTERQGRAHTAWFGGIDVHHVFFEGIYLGADGIWEVHCGS